MSADVDGAMRAFARRLERGETLLPLGPLARAFGELVPLVRPLVVPKTVRALTIGGATLGGSGKTPLAIACARALRLGGARVAFVGHGHRSQIARAEVVHTGDVRAGDEAVEAAGALEHVNVPVVVAPTRQAAVDLASTLADILVIDGPLNLTPHPATAALLAVDAAAPLGSGRCFPEGDLRAPFERLCAHADAVVGVGQGPPAGSFQHHASFVDLRTRTCEGHTSPLSAHAGRSIRVATAIARPGRFVDMLTGAGLRVIEHLERADHDLRPLPPGPWVVPRKNAHLARERPEITWVEYDIDLPQTLQAFLQRRFPA